MSDLTAGWRGVLAVLLCALFAYGAVLSGEFVYDDVPTVRDNPAIQSLDFARFFSDTSAFSRLDSRMYRPVMLSTFAVDWWVGGGAAWVFKLTNLLIHLGVALGLRALLLRLAAAPAAATLAACLFAAHPLASEAVNTVSGRSELLCALGVVCGLLAHLRARDDLRFLPLTALAAVVACGSKEIGVLLPVLAFGLDLPRRQGWSRWLVRHAPAALVVVAYLGVRRVLFGTAVAPMPRLGASVDVMIGGGRDLLTHLCTMATLLPRAFAQSVLPVGLTLDPEVEFVRRPELRSICGAVFMLAVTALGLRRAATTEQTRLRRIGVLGAWLIAGPWIALPLNAPYLEHRMYGPLLCLAAVVASLLPALPAPAARRATATRVASVVLLAYVSLSAVRTLDYADPLTLWQRTAERQPKSSRALCGVATQLIERGDAAAALPYVHRAIAVWPTNPNALNDLVEMHLQLLPAPGNAMVALVLADRLVAMHPANPFFRLLACRALAAAAETTGFAPWFDEAEEHALHCLKIAPPRGLVFRTAANARTRQGNHARALELLDQAIAQGHRHVGVLVDRAACLRRLGRNPEADRQLQQAVAQDPFAPEVAAALAGPPR